MEAPSIDAALREVLERFPEVAAAWLFGSEARGQARETSDVDIALLLQERGKKPADVHLLLGRLAASLESARPGRRIDLSLIECLGPVLQHTILKEGRLVLDANRERRVDFESDCHVRYFDFYPTYALAKRHALSGFRQWLERRE